MCQANRCVECELFAIDDWHSAVASQLFFLFLSSLSETLSRHRILSLPRLAWQLRLEPRKIGARCGNGVRARRKHIYDLKVLKSSCSDTDGTIRSCWEGKKEVLARVAQPTLPSNTSQVSFINHNNGGTKFSQRSEVTPNSRTSGDNTLSQRRPLEPAAESP